jgi:hypothetical protein
MDEVLGLEVADLADRHVGEVVAKNRQDLTDGEAWRVLVDGVPERVLALGHGRH